MKENLLESECIIMSGVDSTRKSTILTQSDAPERLRAKVIQYLKAASLASSYILTILKNVTLFFTNVETSKLKCF